MNIKPLFDRVLIEATKQNATETTGTIILPESSQDKPLIGVVLATGDGHMADGEKVEIQVAVGDKILYNKYSGSEIKDNGKSLVLLRQSEILAIVKGE